MLELTSGDEITTLTGYDAILVSPVSTGKPPTSTQQRNSTVIRSHHERKK